MFRDLVGNAGCEPSSSSSSSSTSSSELNTASHNPLANFMNSFISNSRTQSQTREFQHDGKQEERFDSDDMQQQLSSLYSSMNINESRLNDMGDNFEFGLEHENEDPFFFEDQFNQSGYSQSYMNERNLYSPIADEYLFSAEQSPLSTTFESAVEHFERGRLGEAILAFESLIQRGDASHNPSDLWRWLGTAHAENDEDKKAILCLQNSVKADPENLEALLDIGVSYTNELNLSQALAYLQSWLGNHPEYQGLQAQPQESLNPYQLLDHVINLFHRAADLVPTDVEVFTVLGVLNNLSRNYEEAEKAFQRACELDPKNHSLWNKLGATQANSPRFSGSKDAVHAYRRALELKPNYVRAWVNMGISYSNQTIYDTSAKYYLKALSLNPRSEHVWSYLRISLSSMGREDLASLVDSRDINAFRREFKF